MYINIKYIYIHIFYVYKLNLWCYVFILIDLASDKYHSGPQVTSLALHLVAFHIQAV